MVDHSEVDWRCEDSASITALALALTNSVRVRFGQQVRQDADGRVGAERNEPLLLLIAEVGGEINVVTVVVDVDRVQLQRQTRPTTARGDVEAHFALPAEGHLNEAGVLVAHHTVALGRDGDADWVEASPHQRSAHSQQFVQLDIRRRVGAHATVEVGLLLSGLSKQVRVFLWMKGR